MWLSQRTSTNVDGVPASSHKYKKTDYADDDCMVMGGLTIKSQLRI